MGEEKNIKCSNCGSSQVYLRIKNLEYHCVKCGYNEKLVD